MHSKGIPNITATEGRKDVGRKGEMYKVRENKMERGREEGKGKQQKREENSA